MEVKGMCQLLGMNCNTPTDICFSSQVSGPAVVSPTFTATAGASPFRRRRLQGVLDPQPSVDSPVAELVRNYPIRSLNVIAHIRKATQGSSHSRTPTLPAELWGRYWLFAHNGNLSEFEPTLDGSYLPVGNTDSELAFCHILQSLRQRALQRPARSR